MITKEEAYQIGFDYLKNTNTIFKTFSKIEDVNFKEGAMIMLGERKREYADMWSVSYSVELAGEEYVFIEILAETGEILYSITARGYISGPGK